MLTFIDQLRSKIKGSVAADPVTRQVYSVDASIYEVEPLAVVSPADQEDITTALQMAFRESVPVIARGAATGITGGCLGKGLILDLSRYLNRILEINIEQEYAICEPGVVQEQLNQALSSYGYRLGPDTSTGDRATLGGMLGNNAAGARSLRYGCFADHLLEVTWLNAEGQALTLGRPTLDQWKQLSQEPTPTGRLHRALWELRERYREEIQEHFPKLPRLVSGYRLTALLGEGEIPLCELLAGSEGSLGIVTSMKLRIVRKPGPSVLCLFSFSDMVQAMAVVQTLLPMHPLALELIDHHILESGRQAPSMQGQLDWLKGTPKALVFVECDGCNSSEALEKAKACNQAVIAAGEHPGGYLLTEPSQIQSVWKVRKAGLGLLLSKRSYSRAIAFIEDVAVPPDQIASFMKEFLDLLQRFDKRAGIYGHAGAGCLHIRPYIDLRQASEVQTLEDLQVAVTDLLMQHRGVLSGEHGDGYIRSWLNPKLFGPKLYQAFLELKEIFDPLDRLNPGKVVHGAYWKHDLRLDPDRKLVEPETFQDFSAEGGLALAADLCNGNGLCRKKDGVMCPSFQATNREFDTTRARAQALRAIIQGKWPVDELAGEGLQSVLDLCLACKGCKRECPSQVDMAKMKMEALYQYQEKHGYSLRNRLLGHIGQLFAISRPVAPIVNLINRWGVVRKLLDRMFGIAPNRSLPKIVRRTFSRRVKKEEYNSIALPVVLLPDTFTEFCHPEIGEAAVDILEALGYQVIVPDWHCCGRPMASKGLLKEAAQQLKILVESLYPYALEGVPIVGLEPSCLTMLSDDSRGILGKFWPEGHEKVQHVAKASVTLDAFLYKHLQEGKLSLPWKEKMNSRKYLLHGHCHQKAWEGTAFTKAVLATIPGAKVDEIPSGCCGMAGSFGYESEHEKLSMEIGELKLFPAVREASESTVIVANGTSCRSQVADGTMRKALHLAEAIRDQLIH